METIERALIAQHEFSGIEDLRQQLWTNLRNAFKSGDSGIPTDRRVGRLLLEVRVPARLLNLARLEPEVLTPRALPVCLYLDQPRRRLNVRRLCSLVPRVLWVATGQTLKLDHPRYSSSLDRLVSDDLRHRAELRTPVNLEDSVAT